MKYSLALLKADVQHEIHNIERIVAELQNVTLRLNLDDDNLPSYDRGAIGYILHNFYNGCENIFRCIARFFENDIEDTTWHRDLLRRMTIEVRGYRPAVIDDELYCLLDDFRAFRHKFRHSYAFELDWEKERMVAGKLVNTSRLFTEQIQQFLTELDALDPDES